MTARDSEYIDVVIPVHDEADNILPLLRAFDGQVSTPIRILICYDHEQDTTLSALAGVHSRFPIIPVKNKGRGAHGAATTGFYAGSGPAVISFMADDDYNAGLIDQMVHSFQQGSDIVCASRFMPGGSMTGCRWQKAVLVRAVAFTLYHLGRLPVHDPTNAFRLVSRRLLREVTIESRAGFVYSIELLAKCHRLGWKIAEVPAKWMERRSGGSRFRVFSWAVAYLRWYFYIFATTYFRRREI